MDHLIKGEFYNAAVSRLYYACYYSVVALLVAHKVDTQSHAGVKSMFALHFIKPGVVDKEIAKTFFKLFDLRHNNDYEDFCFCDRQTLEDLRPKSDIFIRTIEEVIKSSKLG